MIDLSNVIALALGSDDVLQIQDAVGTVLWQKTIYYNVNISAGSNGTVSVNGVSGDYSQSVPSGTVLTIEGTGNTGYDFDEWSDGNTTNPRTITVTGDLTLTAAFESAVVYYNVSVSAGSNGTVSVNGVSGDYSQSVASGTNLTIQGNPNNDYIFNGWSDGNTTNPRTIVVNSDLTLTSSFKEEPFYVENNSDNAYNVCVGKNNTSAPNVTVYYSSNGINWSLMGTTENTTTINPITVENPAHSKMYLKATTDAWGISNSAGHYIWGGGSYNVGGNIMSLIYSDDYANKATFPSGSSYNFSNMLRNGNLNNANKLKLPVTTLTQGCYSRMFYNCTSLTTAPVLPATTLANYCYQYMFSGCTALTQAPVLPATTLAESCYYEMFKSCTALTTAPVLPATTLGNECYRYMFDGCTALTTAPARLPASTLKTQCYQYMFSGCTALTQAPVLPATTLASACYGNMFYGCTMLTQAPALPATTLAASCYSSMFQGCTALTTAPATLPATSTNYNGCYSSMFQGCTSLTTSPVINSSYVYNKSCFNNMFKDCTNLNSVTVNIESISSTATAFNNWLSGVAASGDFYNYGTATYTVDSPSGIPQGWTEHKILTYNVSISAGSNGTVSVNGVSGNYSQSVPSGTVLTIEGIGNSGYRFNQWSDGNTDNPRTITVNSAITLTAAFEVLPNYLYIEDVSGSDNTLSIVKESSYAPTITVYKSIDRINWESMGSTDTTAITATVPANGKLYLKATANGWCDNTIQGDRYNTKISASGNHNIGGNSMSLLYGDNFTNQTAFPVQNYGGVFCKLFNNDTTLVNARRLTLPATAIDVDCYYGMFKGCTSLTTPPAALPATTLAIDCYNSMFYGCTSLTSAPTISATTLANRCCNQMFYDCRTLTTAPVLYATTLTTGSYKEMFYNCRLLNSVTTYANDISATGCITNWLANVAATGTFNNYGTATYITDSPSGIPQGWAEPVLDKNYFYIENTSPFDDDFEILSTGAAPEFDIYCSTDKTNWSLMGTTGLHSIETTVESGTKLYLKATTDAWGTSTSDYNYINSWFPYNVGGNIMSLLYGDNFENKTLADTSSTYNFVKLFANDTDLEDASDLVLPEDVTNNCYYGMFKDCTRLTTAPALPATTLAASCYRELFSGCSSLDKIITYATSVSAFGQLRNWVSGVAATGDFYNLGGATYTSGANGIPTGWTEHNSL